MSNTRRLVSRIHDVARHLTAAQKISSDIAVGYASGKLAVIICYEQYPAGILIDLIHCLGYCDFSLTGKPFEITHSRTP